MENQNTNQNNDVDLSEIKQRLKGYADRINDSFFDIILFIKRFIVAIVILVVAGVSAGIYLDSGTTIYKHKIFVTPNFGSVDYLYEHVGRLTAKLKEHDKNYITSLGIKDADKLGRIVVEPVVDIYDFIDERTPDQDNNKIDLFKIIAENGEMEKILEDRITSRNYKNHVITFTTTKKYTEQDLTMPFLKALNSDPYWLQIKKESVNNLTVKMAENVVMIEQINKVLSDYGNVQGTTGVALRTDNTNIADMFNLKNMLLREQAKNRINIVDYQDIVKSRGAVMNVHVTSLTAGNTKIILPILLLILFTGIVKFRDYYRSQLAKRNLK